VAINVLIVDDSAGTRMVIERAIRLSGDDIGDIRHAANGQEALLALREVWIDMIFSDVNMPVMDGWEFIRRVRETEIWSSIPIAAITSLRGEEARSSLHDLGATTYHSKPLSPENIVSIFTEMKARLT